MDDLIKREDAIKALIEWYGCKPNDIEAFEKIIEAIPSADRPEGMWELVMCTDLSEYFEGVKNGFRLRCSNCKDERRRNKPDMNYCPNCGARMKGADNEEIYRYGMARKQRQRI